MQIILSAINSRHTHNAIALAYLSAYWQKVPGRPIPRIMEFDINQTNETIYSELILAKPNVLAFSVYIWSLERVLSVCAAIKAACPDTVIILGGPEASFIDTKILQENDFIDFIIRGEGEATLSELLEAILGNRPAEALSGTTCRHAGKIQRNPDRELIQNMDEIPSPFTGGYFGNGHGFTYYEASRGCPSKCSYCLSSVQGPVRNHSLERVKKDLDWFFDADYRQIRFADRTFNFDFVRAAEIIKYIIKKNHKCINFHFEFQADFMNEEIFSLLQQAPEGMFHLEIGVQSTNKQALTSVSRRFNLKNLQENVTRLRANTGCHLHLDLLGGLPEDSFADFLASLDDVYRLNPHSIQISLVKVLRGTPLEKRVACGDLNCMARPPYTVLRTRWLEASEALEIQDIGKLVEGMYNCDRFNLSLGYLITNLFAGSAAAFFRKLGQWWRKQGFPFYNFGPDNIYSKLSEFVQNENALPCLKGKTLVMLEHEFHLSQKVPCGDSQLGPEFVSGKNKNTLRVVPGLKCFWYAFDLQRILAGGEPINSGAFPAVYSYEKDLSSVPDTRLLQLDLAERFVIASVQRKVALENFPQEWQKCCVAENFTPDFASVIEKLKSDGLLYDSREKNYREVKELIELSRSP
jgi:hypothetical protein